MVSEQIVDKHLVVPLTDAEVKKAKKLALEADTSFKNWTREAILAKIMEDSP